MIDQCLSLVCTRRSIRYLAKKEYFDTKFVCFFKLGAVSLAQKSGALLVPFGITGVYKRGKDNQLTIKFGEPFLVSPKADLLKVNEKLREVVKALL